VKHGQPRRSSTGDAGTEHAEQAGKGFSSAEGAAPHDSPEVVRLKKRIAELKEQMSALQLENSRLREQKTIVVERSRGQERSHGDSVKEQQHNFFKYSNARKY
jgi:hypothetical protein